jgi:HEPN domain-containing protein
MKNSMNQDVKYWGDLSKYDIDTAKAMLESGRYLYVLFTCQQSVEKLLKALVVQNTNKFPPKFTTWLNLAILPILMLKVTKKSSLQN